MDEWTKTRKCEDCGKNFSLSDYGDSTARATAEVLESGAQKLPKNINYIISIKCPECNKKFMVSVIQEEVRRQLKQKSKKWWQFWQYSKTISNWNHALFAARGIGEERISPMTEWTKTRKCQDCGRNFNLSDHDNADAFATAYALEWEEGFDKKINYVYSIKCPECYSENHRGLH